MNTDPLAEQRVLGSIVASSGGILRELHLTADDFAAPAHQELWRAVHAYLDTGRPLTPELLAAFIRDRGRTALLPLLVECMGAVTVPQEAYWHANNLRTLTARRDIQAAQAQLGQLAASTVDYTPEELGEQARTIVDHNTNRTRARGGAVSFADAYLARLEQWAVPDTNVLPTGWLDLDDALTGGLRPGHLTIIGARPAVGKSLMATELARELSSRGRRVLVHSLEMTAGEVVDRIAASTSGVELATLTAQRATEADMDSLTAAVDHIDQWPLTIDDRAGVTVTGIRGRARDLARDGGLDLVIVDYLQLVTPYDRKAPREQQVASVSRGLKLLAKDLGVPVVALAQVNRGGAVERGRPQMHHLRESGAIEADADEIWLLHRDDEDPEMAGLIEVNLAKNRHGSTGPVLLTWVPEAGRIRSLRRA